MQGIELGGGGKDVSTGEFSGATLKAGTFELGTGAKLTGDAVISGATVNGAVGIVAARMTGGTLGATADITGTLEWTGGKMAGPGTTKVVQGGTLILNGISSLTTGRVLENRGLIDARGSSSLFDDFDDPAERIENLGTIRKTAGTSSTIGAPLHNTGTVDGKVGELRIEDGTAEPDTGTFTGTDATNRRRARGQAHVHGRGRAAGDDRDRRRPDGARRRHADDRRHRDPARRRAARQRERDRAADLGRRPPDRAGHDDRRPPPGRIVITPLAAFGCGSASLADGRALVNHGLLRLEKGADLGTSEGVSITNAGRIELDTPNDDSCGSSSGIHGDARLLNTGTIAKTGGTSPSHLRLVVDNDGTINGPLELESDETVTHTGAFKDITLGDGVLVVDAGATLTGTTEVADGELRVLRPVTVATLKQTGGTITGAGTLTVTGRSPGPTATRRGRARPCSPRARRA